jgi:hypothetical protein
MPAGEDVSVSGMVQSGDGAPIPMIKVTIYRDDREVTHAFTGEDGKYVVGSRMVSRSRSVSIRIIRSTTRRTGIRPWWPTYQL